jgi:hypothetical protein
MPVCLETKLNNNMNKWGRHGDELEPTSVHATNLVQI